MSKVYEKKITFNPCFLIHRFIESNKLETTSKFAFRGLRDLTHLYVPKFTF